jgi:hypothetical protein
MLFGTTGGLTAQTSAGSQLNKRGTWQLDLHGTRFSPNQASTLHFFHFILINSNSTNKPHCIALEAMHGQAIWIIAGKYNGAKGHNRGQLEKTWGLHCIIRGNERLNGIKRENGIIPISDLCKNDIPFTFKDLTNLEFQQLRHYLYISSKPPETIQSHRKIGGIKRFQLETFS